MIKPYNDSLIILKEAIKGYVPVNDCYQSTLNWNDYLIEQRKIINRKYLKDEYRENRKRV